MPTIDDFITIPEELLHVAVDAAVYFDEQGYTVSIERRDMGFPFMPAIVAQLGHETHIVEVMSVLDADRVELWVRYCQSQNTDTRFHLVVRNVPELDPKCVDIALAKRIGLLHHDDSALREIRPAGDLAVHVALPETRSLPPSLRPRLGPAFKKIREGDWRDGMGHAYNEVEQLSLEYLKSSIIDGRVTIIRKRKGEFHALTSDDVDGMTLGQLGVAFKDIPNKNHKDSIIEGTIALINKNRVGLAHKRKNSAVEKQLRDTIGNSMYAVISCLMELT
jgi:hypothetical protein